MLLQNTLDLSTFEIVRFRIWNQTSNPDDYGVGTKYFNTNSGHEGYNRENIYTATGWRRTAYMDDIEALTNGEGSLGTRVKALEDMLGLQDVTDVIDTWNDVKEFFANVDEGLTLMTMLNSKVDHVINMSINTNKTLGYGRPDEGWKYYGPAISFGGSNHYAQIQVDHNGDAVVFRRHTPEGFTEWQTILHSGNVGDYTAGAANKIADDTAYTVWGRTFFENGKPKNVSSSPILNNNSGLYFKNAAGDANKLLFYFDSAEQLHIGRDSATDKHSTHIYGNPTYFKSSATGQPLMTITDRGRVVVGTNASVDGDKLYSRGRVNILSLCDNPTLGNMPEHGLILTNNTSQFGMLQWVSNSSGVGNIQVGRFDGTATAYALNLNPLGGAVNVGSGGLNVNSNIESTGSLYLGTEGSACGVYLRRKGHNFIWATSESGTIYLGVKDSGNVSTSNASLAVYYNSVTPGTRNNAVSLGISGWRWSNVYSVNGDFSGYLIASDIRDILPSGAKYHRYRILHSDAGMYIQSATHDGTSVNGIINITGINGNNLANFNVKATGSSFSGRVLIGNIGSSDIDENAILQWSGTAKSVNATYGNIEICTARGLSWHVPASLSSWTRGLYAYDNSNPTPIGIFGFKGAEQVLEYAFIGNSATSTWFTINSTESNFNVLTKFNAGALIPTGQTLTIGSVTFRETAAGEVEVDGNLHTTGTLASGGKGEVGENTTGNAMVYQYDLASGESVYTVDNVKGSTNVIVQIFEWNSNTSSWDMILTDVSVKADAITVTFGRTTTVNHMVTVC